MDNNTLLTRGVAEILPSKKDLEDLLSKRKITLYQGFDPSADSLHLGNLVGVMKLSQFQKLGHKIIFLVGDFTGMIGDPTDKPSARTKLSREQVLENSENWKDQIKNILDFEGPNKAEIKYNSQWNDKINFKKLIDITSNVTVQQMIERDMFQRRIDEKKPIFLHEFLYPIAQGYDSVEMEVDLEVGGSDQIFNMLVGRTLLRSIKNKNKFVLGTKLLVDSKGDKVGKTTGNALFLSSGPVDFYGGIMSFPDEIVFLAYELLTTIDLTGMEEKIKNEPLTQKKSLAWEIVKNVWSKNDADTAQKSFERTFQHNDPIYNTKVKSGDVLSRTIAPFTANSSVSEAKRLIQQGGVDVNNKTLKNPAYKPAVGDKIRIGEKTFIEIN